MSLGIATSTTVVGTTVGYLDHTFGSCDDPGGSGGPDRVYMWQAPSTGLLNVSLCPSTTDYPYLDSILYIRDASSGTELGCNDQASWPGGCSGRIGSQITG